ncbi:MAG: DUF4097 family beta strand repeat-containing protein [Ignavibacteriaceae bacterium]|nr:DUF4097 family beta strand repeat-containing protein [Ignavibacteriaceae bacterium]
MIKILLFSSILILAALGVSCTMNSSYFDDQNLQVLQEKTFQINQGKTLNLDASSANIEISTWDKNEVYIKITGNNRAKEKTTFTFHNDENSIEVAAKTKSSFWGFISGIKMRFEIKVPKNFNPETYTSGGNIKLEGLIGNSILKTSGGNIYVKDSRGNVRTNTSGGEIRIENVSGNIKLSTSGGNIAATNFTGDFDGRTSGGNIKITGIDSKIYAETSGGNIKLDYNGANKGIELSTSGGDIAMNLPADFDAAARLSTSGGRISCDFRGNNAVKISSSKFEADINKGGKPLYAKTSGGNIEVSKR